MLNITQDATQDAKHALIAAIDSTPQKSSRFFKVKSGDYAQHDQFLGITVPTLRRVAKQFATVLSLMDLKILIKSPINEERLFALIILVQHYNSGDEGHREEIYRFYINNISYINNWNLVDSSAHLILGAHLFKRDPTMLENLARSQNLWERRIAIVATWYFIRESQLDWTFRIAKLLQTDHHDLIHKAVGWMLREAGKKDEERLISFLNENGRQMPAVMLRHAMERLPLSKRCEIKKYK
ncbi:putative DNA alkylation repair enzyme [Rickettsiales endosymbiont of Paramecium tredecaurelia]|uniref:DNA alkylation repair protein n=1 Tax=Candidatus Sarmatiella mevalonica TaxID=2770581 RepID=UPI001921BCDF|nr:DNA alkylation repair protein [Candidatus Sarmatiella mevalonica]MBL3284749.1 putative DNA alkylation repair enzyme [Candidatus Sarmatiella mevalonica]